MLKCHGTNGRSFTHQFANERDGPLLAQLRHAVDAKGRVPAARHRAKSLPLKKMRCNRFAVESLPYWPWLGPRMLAGVTVLLTTLKRSAEVKGEAIRKPQNPHCSHAHKRRRDRGEEVGGAGWVSVLHAKEAVPIHHSGPSQYEHHKSVSPYKHLPDHIYIWEVRRVLI